jgi:hypothetical protein
MSICTHIYTHTHVNHKHAHLATHAHVATNYESLSFRRDLDAAMSPVDAYLLFTDGDYGDCKSRYREIWGNTGKYGEIQGNMGKYREIWANIGDLDTALLTCCLPTMASWVMSGLGIKGLGCDRIGYKRTGLCQDWV